MGLAMGSRLCFELGWGLEPAATMAIMRSSAARSGCCAAAHAALPRWSVATAASSSWKAW